MGTATQGKSSTNRSKEALQHVSPTDIQQIYIYSSIEIHVVPHNMQYEIHAVYATMQPTSSSIDTTFIPVIHSSTN